MSRILISAHALEQFISRHRQGIPADDARRELMRALLSATRGGSTPKGRSSNYWTLTQQGLEGIQVIARPLSQDLGSSIIIVTVLPGRWRSGVIQDHDAEIRAEWEADRQHREAELVRLRQQNEDAARAQAATPEPPRTLTSVLDTEERRAFDLLLEAARKRLADARTVVARAKVYVPTGPRPGDDEVAQAHAILARTVVIDRIVSARNLLAQAEAGHPVPERTLLRAKETLEDVASLRWDA